MVRKPGRGVGKALSFVDFVKRNERGDDDDDPHALRVPATATLVSQYLLLYTMSSSAEDFDSLIDPAHRVGVLRVYLKEDSTRFAAELITRLRARLPGALPSGIRVEITGSLALERGDE